MRGFEKVSKVEISKFNFQIDYENIILPRRSTKGSAGYDIMIPFSLDLKPNEKIIIPTGIKAFMGIDEVLLIVIRSSLGIKYGLRLQNQMGVIDSDYYNNQDNEGHILLAIENTNEGVISLKAGDRIAQGIFTRFLTTTDEATPKVKRLGGIGSTSI